jgi:hypothetical protein
MRQLSKTGVCSGIKRWAAVMMNIATVLFKHVMADI